MYNGDYAILINGVSKMFKMYKNPKHRILDLLGFGKFTAEQYQEFWALKDIDLKIKRGSKIALIGRNGAGKSTLLKIITGILQPTNGTVYANGKVSALMDLGTGFHPEFSGKENIFASLAYSGVIGKEAEEKYEEIVDFSELGEFIDKPVKTYSAGMYARLAFATSTAIVPEILIIDEILGAGDAYFINKSINRMKKLTEGGTTVLFVSHDMVSVQKMCDEAIWIDKGNIIMQGHILDVSAEYMDSIRKQEERKLRSRNVRLKSNDFRTLEEASEGQLVYVHLISENGSPKNHHPISEIKLYFENKLIQSVLVGSDEDSNNENALFLITDNERINWSDRKINDGNQYRNYEDIGGEYQHALFAFKVNSFSDINKYKIEITYKDISNEVIKVEYYEGETYKKIGQLKAENDGMWKQTAFIFNENSKGKIDELKDEEELEILELEREKNVRIYGSGEVVITSVSFLDENDNDKLIFTSNTKKKIKINYYAKEKVYNPVFVVAYYLLDGTCAMQLISNKDGLEVGTIEGEGSIEIIFDPLLLGKGNYLVSVAIFKNLNLVDNLEPEAYDLHDKMYEIKVEQPFGLNVELGIIHHPVRWNKKIHELR
ncbi:MAG TPA: ABC transporter ATP-binding protein [Bacillus bacterium]|nr:ABC transporter ATP-binding protein [Bacillus sp. (in: firmicutes)]